MTLCLYLLNYTETIFLVQYLRPYPHNPDDVVWLTTDEMLSSRYIKMKDYHKVYWH